MIAKLSDLFILLFSASVFGGIFFLLAEILYRTKIISAGENYRLLHSILVFHLISPIFAAAFFVRSAKPTIHPVSSSLSFRDMVHHFRRCFSEGFVFPEAITTITAL